MKMHPAGQPNVNSITVRLVKDPHIRRRRPATINIAEIQFSDLSEDTDEENFRGPDFEHNPSTEDNMRRELDQETIQHTEDEFSAENSDEDNIWGDASSTEPEQDAQPTTGQTSMIEDDIENTWKPETERENHRIGHEYALQLETITLLTADNPNLDALYNFAINDLRRRIKPSARDLKPQAAATAYHRWRCLTIYKVPIGDRSLNIMEGEQIFRIRKQIMRALLVPEACHNLITRNAQERARLIAHEVPNNSHTIPPGTGEPITIRYCANVPIEIGEGPILPGIFLVVTRPLPDGVDLIVAKPWLMGIIKKYEGYKLAEPTAIPKRDDVLLPYESDLNHQIGERPSTESLMDLNSFVSPRKGMEDSPDPDPGNLSESDSSWVEITEPRRGRTMDRTERRHTAHEPRRNTRRQHPEARIPPALLGGSLARTL